MVFGFLGPEVKAGGAFEKGYAGGMRLSVGALLPFGEKYKAFAEASAAGFFLGERHETALASLTQNLKLGSSSSVSLMLQAQRIEEHDFTDASLGWNYYF